MDELADERKLAPLAPVVFGGALVVPMGLLGELQESANNTVPTFAADTRTSEMAAMRAVMEQERRLGFLPVDVSAEKCGYDIESRIPGSGRLRFIEVKGRAAGADTVIITKNEILTALNKPEDYILALVEVSGDAASSLRYVRKPFGREPDFGVTCVVYRIAELLSSGVVENVGQIT